MISINQDELALDSREDDVWENGAGFHPVNVSVGAEPEGFIVVCQVARIDRLFEHDVFDLDFHRITSESELALSARLTSASSIHL